MSEESVSLEPGVGSLWMSQNLELGLMSLMSVVLLAVMAIGARAQTTREGEADLEGWDLVWEEDFNDRFLDSEIWSLCERAGSDWNDSMSADRRLVIIDNGVLRLRGIVNDDRSEDPSPYLTAGLNSKGKYSFQYGKVEIRARFTDAQGVWPALWMLGEERGWPANGEIDLMEHLNFDDHVYQTLHSPYTLRGGQANAQRHGSTTPFRSMEWNTYGCEWDEERVIMTVNGEPNFTYRRVEGGGEDQWPFNQPFYFVLSMQIGGNWVNGSGATNPEQLPAELQVDWIRVYERAEG